MATESQPTISISDDELTIEQLTIEDPDVIQYLTSREEAPAETARLALQVGVSTLRLSDTTEEAEFVRNEFNKMNSELEAELDDFRDELEEWLDHEDGEFAEIIEDTFGENGQLVEEVFDPTVDGTPLQRFRSEIENQLQDMRDSLLEQEVEERVEETTTKKGENFEDDLNGLLTRVARSTDEIKRTGDEHGQVTDRFVGDFVLTLGDTQQDIVIEAKHVSQLSKPEIKRQLEEGMKNRGADYGVLVLRNENAASDFLGAFREFDQQMLYVAISDEDSERYDERLLNLALEWARMRTLSQRMEADDKVDPEVINNKVGELEDTLSRFQNVRTKCTNIKTARQGIEDELDEIEAEIEEELETIVAELRVGSPS